MKLLTAFILGLMLASAAAEASSQFSTDAFIRSMETMFGKPGTRKPVVQCQCSLEYLGTKSEGRGVYAVYLKKLD